MAARRRLGGTRSEDADLVADAGRADVRDRESGFDRNPPAPVSQGLEIVREFLDMKGNPVARVKTGEEFLIRLRLRSARRDIQRQVAVVDLLPGGVEAVTELRPATNSATAGVDPASGRGPVVNYGSLPIGLPEKSTWTPEHVEVREDRVVLYGDVTKNAATFVYRVRAVSVGVFQAPPAFAEGMYDRTVLAIGPAGRLEVVKP